MAARDASGRFVKGSGSSSSKGAGGSASVKVVDHGYDRVIAAASDAAGKLGITVGIHSDASGEVLEKAERNEFGLGVPPRPFISGWADERRESAVAEMRDALAAILKAGGNPRQKLAQLAAKYAGEIQQRIAGGIDPPNAPSTIARKGSSTPLIDSGQLRSSISGRLAEE